MLSFIDHKSIMIQEPFCRLLGEAHVSVLQRTLNEWKAHFGGPLRPLAERDDVEMFACLRTYLFWRGYICLIWVVRSTPMSFKNSLMIWTPCQSLTLSLLMDRLLKGGTSPWDMHKSTRNLAFQNLSHHFKFKDQPWTTMVFCPILWDAWQAGMRFCLRDPEMSRNFIFPGFVNRHGENHGKKNRDPRVYRENPWFRNILSNMVGFPHRQRSTRTRRAEGAGGAGSVAAAASRGSGQSGRLAETVTSLQGIAPSDEHLGL